MKLLAPSYYKKFKCIADKCTHSCCIGWEIDIDTDTYEKYSRMRGEFGKEILKSIEISDTPHFKLQKNDRCPHLDENGLCRIITNVGEEYLCEICREHPRFYNFTSRGCEVGLGMACEEACRIILGEDFFGELDEIGEIDGDIDESFPDPSFLRKDVLTLLSRDLSHKECLKLLYDELGISGTFFESEEYRHLILSLEYLDNRHRDLFLSNTGAEMHDEKKLKRALAYFVYRHCAVADSLEDFYRRLGFCLFCEALLRRTAAALGSLELAARIVSEELEYSPDNTEAIMSCFNF